MLLLPTAIDALAPLADTGGMDAVQAQYEAFPYPARAPGDEARRLIEGSPSHPVEIDHFLFGGRRDCASRSVRWWPAGARETGW